MNRTARRSFFPGTPRPAGLVSDIPSRPYWGPGRAGTIAGIVVRFVVFLVRGAALFRADSGFSRI